MSRPYSKHHRITAVAADGSTRKIRAHAPTGGYVLSCSCGWQGGTCRVFKDAERVFADHVRKVASYECRNCARDISTAPPIDRRNRECGACRQARRIKERVFASEEAKKDFVAKRRSTFLKSKYGITDVDLDLMISFQNGECKICADPLVVGVKTGLHVDHCHATGALRGLLCNSCNMGLGLFRDDPLILLNAIRYLHRALPERNTIPVPYHAKYQDQEKVSRGVTVRQDTIASMQSLLSSLVVDEWGALARPYACMEVDNAAA